MTYRPKHYVPIQVPVFNEIETQKVRSIDPGAPAQYAYVYRPEMQFSLYDLPQLGYVESEETHYNLIDPSATQDTDIFFDNFNFIYTLLADEQPPLEQLGPGRELVFALGAQEITAQIGADNTLEFNPAQLVLLESEDYLAIRLYQNGNDENILWEYAYGFLPQGGPDDHQVSADDHVVDLYFYLPYKVNESTPNPKKVTIKWQVEGPGGVVEEETQSSTDGLYNNRLFVSTNPGDEYWVTAEITDSEDPRFMVGQTTTIGPITVIPGEPQTLLLTPSQTTFAADMTSEITVDLFAVDAFGNPVADNSKVDWNIVGDVTETSPVTNGQATVTYHAQSLTGTAKITANIGNSYGQTQVVIDPPGGLNLAIDPRLVIGDQSSDGIHVDETLTGTMALAYNTTTDLEGRNKWGRFQPVFMGMAIEFRSMAIQCIDTPDKSLHGPVSKISQLGVLQIRESICRPLLHDPKRPFGFGAFEPGTEILFELFEPGRMFDG